MPPLHERQQQFAQALLAQEGSGRHGSARAIPVPTSGTASRLELANARTRHSSHFDDRIAVYRRNVFANYRNALAATYPVIRRLVGVPFFNAAVDSYVVEYPSTCGDLNVYGDRFGEFLAGYAPAGSLPYLRGVACLEWAIDDTHRAPDARSNPAQVIAAFSVVPADRLPALRIRLAPSCRLVASSFPILHIWRTNQTAYAGARHVALDEGADHVLVRRDPEGVSLERVACGDHAFLAALASDVPLGEAIVAAQRADATFDLESALRAHIAAGTLMEVVAG
jgi:hypothetical protein